MTSGLLREPLGALPTGTWRYFLVLDDRIVEIPPGAMPEDMASRPFRDNTPGPDRSGIIPAAPAAGKFYCPFMVSTG